MLVNFKITFDRRRPRQSDEHGQALLALGVNPATLGIANVPPALDYPTLLIYQETIHAPMAESVHELDPFRGLVRSDRVATQRARWI